MKLEDMGFGRLTLEKIDGVRRWVFNGDLELDDYKKDIQLPDNLLVLGSLDISYTNIDLPKNIEIQGYLRFTENKVIEKLPSGLKCSGSIFARHSKLKELPDGFVVEKDLDISFSKIEKLPNNLKIKGDFFCLGKILSQIPNSLECRFMFFEENIKNIYAVFAENGTSMAYIEPKTNEIIIPSKKFRGTIEETREILHNLDNKYREAVEKLIYIFNKNRPKTNYKNKIKFQL